MSHLPKNSHGCPYLFLAPMEGVGDECFRKTMASVGGFDEGVRDFLRVPQNAHVKSLAAKYQANEISPFPLAAQIMGSDPELMGEMACELEERGAPRVDLNCGCPSNTVTGKGAGSSLLKDPMHLHKVAAAMVNAVSIPVTAKLRSGFDDISLFKENLLAAEESGIAYLTLHPRTKAEGYSPKARWDLICEAKSILSIPLVGNGDIFSLQDALDLLALTSCDALMIGRGSLINPFIFHQIKEYFAGTSYVPKKEAWHQYIQVYYSLIPKSMREHTKINKLKQLLSFLFKSDSKLLEKRQDVLKFQTTSIEDLLHFSLSLINQSLCN